MLKIIFYIISISILLVIAQEELLNKDNNDPLFNQLREMLEHSSKQETPPLRSNDPGMFLPQFYFPQNPSKSSNTRFSPENEIMPRKAFNYPYYGYNKCGCNNGCGNCNQGCNCGSGYNSRCNSCNNNNLNNYNEIGVYPYQYKYYQGPCGGREESVVPNCPWYYPDPCCGYPCGGYPCNTCPNNCDCLSSNDCNHHYGINQQTLAQLQQVGKIETKDS